MTRPKTAAVCGLPPHWKVRVSLPGSILHLVSRTEPAVRLASGRVASVDMDLITGTEHGDTIGFIDWPAALAVTWRFAPPALLEEREPKKPAPATRGNSAPAGKVVGKRIAAARAILRR